MQLSDLTNINKKAYALKMTKNTINYKLHLSILRTSFVQIREENFKTRQTQLPHSFWTYTVSVGLFVILNFSTITIIILFTAQHHGISVSHRSSMGQQSVKQVYIDKLII